MIHTNHITLTTTSHADFFRMCLLDRK